MRERATESLRPEQITRSEHHEYYERGGTDDKRLRWAVETFLTRCQGKRILEIGSGDGKLLSLLPTGNELYGIDASATGVEKCRHMGIEAFCLDVSTECIPFPSDYFDVAIILETFEHLMSPYFALLEIRRVLKENGTLICSVPNPRTGHLYLYPGLFGFKKFSKFLEQSGLRIVRVVPWEWAPREMILPSVLRKVALLRSRYVAGALRRVVERAWRALGCFPWFCYWLWTFECINENKSALTVLEMQVAQTRPGGKWA